MLYVGRIRSDHYSSSDDVPRGEGERGDRMKLRKAKIIGITETLWGHE
jgi:hypothetical protein